MPDIQWVAPVHDRCGSLLYYQTNEGNFVSDSNFVTDHIMKVLESGDVETREPEHLSIDEIEISIFLPRHYTLFAADHKEIEQFEFDLTHLPRPFPARVQILNSVESDYFKGNEHLERWVKNASGNVIRIGIDRKGIVKVFKWAKHFLGSELQWLEESKREDIALHKRSQSQGPTTNWYFSWLVLQQYIGFPTLEIVNKLVDLINHQAHRKTTGFLSLDDLGDVAIICAKAEHASFLWPLSGFRDEQVQLFPFEFNWPYHTVHRSFQRVRFLLDRGLYFEAIVVAQAILEGLVNAMFTPDLLSACFAGKEPKWETRHQLLKRFIEQLPDGNFLKDSQLIQYLRGKLQRIYVLRNKYAHDVLENKPEYDYQRRHFAEVFELLKPMTDTWENHLFLNEIASLHSLHPEFTSFAIATTKTRLTANTNVLSCFRRVSERLKLIFTK